MFCLQKCRLQTRRVRRHPLPEILHYAAPVRSGIFNPCSKLRVQHIILSVPAWLEEEYRQPLLTFQSTEASEELLLRKRASLAES